MKCLMPSALLLAVGALFPASQAGAQTLEEAQTQFLHGNYADVITNAQSELADNPYQNDWRQLLVNSLMTVGRYDDAYSTAVAGLNAYSSDFAMRLLARETA
ncbi:MAG TPA: hypothetical protein VFY06_12470, partial [Verrucomicrobiae bacterium]|nr:hypothetical protein [Verrucomicrobiae bacterium]